MAEDDPRIDPRRLGSNHRGRIGPVQRATADKRVTSMEEAVERMTGAYAERLLQRMETLGSDAFQRPEDVTRFMQDRARSMVDAWARYASEMTVLQAGLKMLPASEQQALERDGMITQAQQGIATMRQITVVHAVIANSVGKSAEDA